jgi:hypothetical protein
VRAGETRKTTLSEDIEAFIFAKFTVEKNKKVTSKGSIASQVRKLCPPRL